MAVASAGAHRSDASRSRGPLSTLGTLLLGYALTKLAGAKRGAAAPVGATALVRRGTAAPARRPDARRDRGSSDERSHAGPEAAR